MLKKIFFLTVVLFFIVVTNAQQNNTFLWRINNPANKQPSYLFGTIHLPQERFMLLADSVYRAVSNTDFFYGELDYLNIYKEMNDNDGFFQSKLNHLDSVKKTTEWKRMIATINRKYHVSINPDSLKEFNEFGQNLLADYMKPDPGVTALDIALSAYAFALGKTTKGLEKYKFQIDMLYKIIDARLTDTTLLFDDDITLTANLKQFYAAEQFDSLTNLIENINTAYRKVVFDSRNITMADSIQDITKNKTAFFAVGCGHLLGRNGLIKLLRLKGLQITPVLSGKKFSITAMKFFIGAMTKSIKKELRKPDDSFIPDSNPPKRENIEVIREEEGVKVAEKNKGQVKKFKSKKQ
jgi:uncharacterized protein YbaP (TraB family)